MKRIFYAYVAIVLVISACSSGKSTFERGNYYEAVITSVNRLRKNSDHKKSVETLRQAYPMAVTFYEDRAKTAIASTEPFKWNQVVNAYTAINHMYDEIRRCPGALKVIPDPVNYFSKLQEARQNAAEENYAAGINALQFKDREKAKQAYTLFKTANEFVPGYKDVIQYMAAALDAATVKIVVEPIPVHSKSAGVSAEFFNDKISEFVHSAPISEFVRFYSRKEAETTKVKADHIIQLQFDDFTIGQVYKHEKEIQLTRDSVVMGTYVTPSSAQQQSSPPDQNAASGRSALAVNKGSGVLASKEVPVATSTAPATESAAERAAREKAELTAQERILAEKLRAEKEAADREAAKKAEAERLAEEARMAQVKAQQAQAEKEAADKAHAEALQRDAAAKAQADKVRAERELAEKLKAEKEEAERERQAQEIAAREAAEKARLEKESADREAAEKLRLEKERADRESAEKARLEKERLEREKAEELKYEKNSVDPSIKPSDTLNVKDPVTICHIPPGNPSNRRTLIISRAALKAHLGHGDIEGGCDPAEQKDKQPGPGEEKKDRPAPKGKPAGDKGKGPGASGNSINASDQKNSHALLFNAQTVVLASAGSEPGSWLRYADAMTLEADTNKVYGTVKATLYHNTKTTTAKGVVSFRIVDAKTGALLSSEKMPGEYVWVSEWATFNGDERALSAEQLKLTRLKEQPAPAPQDMFIAFTDPIYDQITAKIAAFYKGY